MPKRARSVSAASSGAGASPVHPSPPRASSSAPAHDSPGRSPPLEIAEQLRLPPPAIPTPHLPACTSLTAAHLAAHTAGALADDNSSTYSCAHSEGNSEAVSMAKDTVDTREKLGDWKIWVKSDQPLPPALQKHVDEVLKKPLPPGARSPNPKEIRNVSFKNDGKDEDAVKVAITRWLFFEESENPAIHTLPNVHFAREFLPKCPDDSVLKTWKGKGLEEAQPDTAIGYWTDTDVMQDRAARAALFTRAEEREVRSCRLTNDMLFPFLTAQWKGSDGDDLSIAECQGARDGASVVNYMHHLHSRAYGGDAPPEIAHSLTVVCNARMVEISIHWRESDDGTDFPNHYEQFVAGGVMKDVDQMSMVRLVLKNHLEFALHRRREWLRSTLSALRERSTALKSPALLSKALSPPTGQPPPKQAPSPPESTGGVEAKSRKRARIGSSSSTTG